MKLSQLLLRDLYRLKKYNKKQLKDYKMFTEHDRITNINYMQVESNVIEIENVNETYTEKITY